MFTYCLKIRKKYALLVFIMQMPHALLPGLKVTKACNLSWGKAKVPSMEGLAVELPLLNYLFVGHFAIVWFSGFRDRVIEFH